ncbi:MAG: acyltransferase domain-containing protein [Proteocatella sp.]
MENVIMERVRANKHMIEIFMGYGSKPVPPVIVKHIEEELEKLEHYLDIEYEYKLMEKENQPKAFIIYTVGQKIEEQINKYMDEAESIRATIVDKMAVVALDQIKAYIIEKITRKTGFYVTGESYPGTSKCSMKSQKQILESMENIKTISVDEQFQLKPTKSIAMEVSLKEESKAHPIGKIFDNPYDSYEDKDKYYQMMYVESKRRAEETLAKYKLEEISEQIYYDTMSDIDVWAEAYKKTNGHYGIKEVKWIEKSLEMKVFKLGRLQFELLEGEPAQQIIQESGLGGELLVLDTHIQSGAPLEEGQCEKSYNMAAEFYSERGYKFSDILFTCDSWLLNPKLKNMLDPGSNIIGFQNKYTIISEKPLNRQMEERVFGELKYNPVYYQEKNSLQKNLKKALLKGEKLGTARGTYLWKLN